MFGLLQPCTPVRQEWKRDKRENDDRKCSRKLERHLYRIRHHNGHSPRLKRHGHCWKEGSGEFGSVTFLGGYLKSNEKQSSAHCKFYRKHVPRDRIYHSSSILPSPSCIVAFVSLTLILTLGFILCAHLWCIERIPSVFRKAPWNKTYCYYNHINVMLT